MQLPSEATLKAAAYEMSKNTGMKRGHCYEKIAKSHGFNNYAAMRAAMKTTGGQK